MFIIKFLIQRFDYRILLKFGCPVNGVEIEKGYTPLFEAVKFGSLSVVIELIENGAHVNFISHNEKSISSTHSSPLITSTPETPQKKAVSEKTPMFRARTYDIVKYLIQKGAKPIVYSTKTDEKINAIEHLMKHNPEAARAVFDDCLDIDKDSNLIMDFKIFTSNNNDCPEDEMKLLICAEEQSKLRCIGDVNLRKLLVLHPLLQIFLNLKFKTIRYYFNLLLVFQFLMVVMLTLIAVEFVQFTDCYESSTDTLEQTRIVVMAIPWNPYDGITQENLVETLNEKFTNVDNTSDNKCYKNRYFEKDTFCTDDNFQCDKHITGTTDGSYAFEKLCKKYYNGTTTLASCWTFHWLTIITMIVLLIHLVKECLEIISKKSFVNYIFSMENLFEFIILGSAVSFLVISHFDIVMAYHAASWMVFFAWVNLILYLGRISLIGKYIFMSFRVMRVLFLCLIAYLPVFFGFTFGYYILLQANQNFNGYIRGFISVLAMMIDEIGYGQFDYKTLMADGGLNGSTQVMTIFFMIFVSLILMNLLIAVTINNTDMLNDQSRINVSERRINQLDEVLKFRKWSTILKGFKYIPKLKDIGLPVFRKTGESEEEFKLVSSIFFN